MNKYLWSIKTEIDGAPIDWKKTDIGENGKYGTIEKCDDGIWYCSGEHDPYEIDDIYPGYLDALEDGLTEDLPFSFDFESDEWRFDPDEKWDHDRFIGGCLALEDRLKKFF